MADIPESTKSVTASDWVNSMPGVRPTDQFIGVDRRVFEDCIARAIAAARLGRPAVIPKVCRNPVPMTLPDAIAQCHVRSSIFRIADPARMYAKNHFMPLLERIPADQHNASDWLEHDPREGSEQAWLDFTRAAPPAMDREVVDFLHQLRRVNTERYEAWVEGADAGIMFDALELGGEVGELLNVVKKLEREERGWRGSRADPADFADECADVLICLDKLARRRGVDLIAATIAKFNATSDKVGLPHKLSTLSADAIRQGEGVEREWPDIGDDPMKSRPYEDRMAVSADAIRKAYTVQQPIVPDQTALVWRWHLGALLEAEIRLRSILADEPATPASHASDGGKA